MMEYIYITNCRSLVIIAIFVTANAFFDVNGMLIMGCMLFGRVFTVLIAPRLPHSQAPPPHTRTRKI